MARIGRWFLIIIGAIVVAVAAYYLYLYFFGNGEKASEITLGTEIVLDCSEECASYGQCGTKMDDDIPVVLAGKDAIMVELHNLYFINAIDGLIIAENTAVVNVDSFETEEVNEAGLEVQFWKVRELGEATENTQEGWVAEWCVKLKTDE